MKFGILAACILLIAGSGVQASPARLAQAERAIKRSLEREVAADQLVGIVWAVTDRDRLLAIAAHGYADRKPMRTDAPMPIGSISKSFTAIALLRQMDRQRFDPAQPISTVLPWFVTDPRYPPVTGLQLLTHTAALPHYRSDLSSNRMAAVAMRDWKMAYAPGEHFWYSDIGYQILGYALEAIEHRSYRAAIDADILKPLGMVSTVAVIDDAQRPALPIPYARDGAGKWVEGPWFEYTASDGSVVATATDLAAYLRMLLNGGVTPKGPLLSPAAFQALTTPAQDGYALGLLTKAPDGSNALWNSGAIAGFKTLVDARPADGVGVVVLSNGMADIHLADWIVETIHRAYRDQPPTAPPLPLQPPPPAASFAGLYRDAGGKRLTLRAEHGILAIERDDRAEPLRRNGADVFSTAADVADADAYIFAENGVSHGAEWYAKTAPAATPTGLKVLVGHYTAHNPEGPDSRVFVQDGMLMIRQSGETAGGDVRLLPAGETEFRPSAPVHNPERISFDTVVDGHALRMTVSGQHLYRIDTP